MSWNCFSISNKKQELLHFLQEHKIDIALLQDTFLKPGKRFKVPNFIVYRDDKVGVRNGGTLILVRSSLSHNSPPPSYNLVSAEATTVSVNMSNNSTIVISSVYQRNSQTHPVVLNDYRTLLGPDNQRTILGGDFNAKNVLWGNLSTNRNGTDLYALQNRFLFNPITPDEPTFIGGRGQADFLDMFLVKNLNLRHNIRVLHELSSDHLPVILTIGNPADRIPDSITQKFTDWNHFQQFLQNTDPIPRINNPQDLDAAVNKLTTDIQQAISHATVTRTLPAQMKGKLPAHIKELIREKNRIRRRATRTGDPNIKRLANQHIEQVREALYQFHNDRWNSKLEDLNPNTTSVWRMARAVSSDGPSKMPTLRHANSTASSPQEKADLLAEILEDRFQPNPHTHPRFGRDAVVTETIRLFNQTPLPPVRIFTTPQIVKSIIQTRPVRKAPGHDKISVKSLKELPAKQISEITNIINGILRLSYFPPSWKKAEIVMIRKPFSPSHEADSYRPISLISTLGKVAEKVVLEVIRDSSVRLNIIPDEQFGFQPKHGTIHHTAKLAQLISSSFNQRARVGAVFLDISKAFDKVWHEGLILKFIRFGYPHHLTTLVQSFLSERTFQVRVDQSFSEVRRIRAGVPQGSALSPHLFNIYVSDIPKDRFTTLQLYADDTAISTSARRFDHITARLQRHLTSLSDWFDRWRIKVNPAKTQAIIFDKRPRRIDPPPLSLNGTRLRWAKSIKYLGLLYDQRLVWKDQVPAVVRKANQLLGKLYPLLNHRSRLSTNNKLLIYKMIIRAGLTYGCQAWCHMSKTHRAKVQTVQNRALRIIAGAPWFVRNNQLHREFEMPTIKEFTRIAQLRFLEKATAHPNPEIANTFRANANVDNRHLRPTDIIQLD